ncbi:uncharacterized protein LOC130210559 [Pseudoliparis swirei]|uniref:uncharacterized protein LOC130210559 n=1 Tax=Pseudoliparis swirei TaxID=2059687 RepID=UPI0024BEDEB1|nr:uncharacterized protein LOC130210559 [Pseudoliparis swirei]
MDDVDPQGADITDEDQEYQEDADDVTEKDADDITDEDQEYQEDADDAVADEDEADDAVADQDEADDAVADQDEADDAVADQDEADDFDPARVEADGMQRGQDRQPVFRLPACTPSSAVRVQDPGQPNHPQFHLFPSTPTHYRFNTCRPCDFPEIEELGGWVGVPHDRSHAPIPITNRKRLSPGEAGIVTEPLYAIWHENYQYLQRWAITHPFFTGYPPANSLTGLQILWDLSLGNAQKDKLQVRQYNWPYQAVEDWAVISTVTQCSTVSGLQITLGMDVVICTGAPCPFDIAPTFYGMKEWESVSQNGLELHTSRPQYPPSSPPVLRWAQREREEREAAPLLPPPDAREIAGDREIHRRLAKKIKFYQTMARSRAVRPGQDEDLAWEGK